MILLIDYDDSFTYNLAQCIGSIGDDIVVFSHDECTVEKIKNLSPRYIVLSSGPYSLIEKTSTLHVITHFCETIPMLGVGLGYQMIAKTFGGEIVHTTRVMHGKTTAISHDKKTIFNKLPNPLRVACYHSLVVNKNTLPQTFEVSAQLEDGEIMGIRHKQFPLEGIQFHPESILTEQGERLFRNFFETYRKEG